MTRILLDMGLCFFVLIRSKAADVKKNIARCFLENQFTREKGDDT
jgi:hypothetical protein